VTAAAMLVRREAFEAVNGFDTAFRNSLEDTDLCLRLGERGHEVRYCPDSVVYHLESVSRARRSEEVAKAGRLFQERWGDKVERDDLRRYVEDGLLRIRYRDLYPLKVELAPELALAAGPDLSRFIEIQSGQIADLLRETVRLTAHVADRDMGTETARGASSEAAEKRPEGERKGKPDGRGLAGLVADAERLQLGIRDFQESVADAIAESGAGPNGRPSFTIGDGLSQLELGERLRAVVEAVVPPGATILVVSRGDDRLLELGERRAWHFPQEDDGTYAGRHPADSDEAIELLERLRGQGARYFVIPEQDAWWLEHYAAFAGHLAERSEPLTHPGAPCRIFRLEEVGR
jgi:hypothetical protein